MAGTAHQKKAGAFLLLLLLAAPPLSAQTELWDKAAALAKLGEAFLPHTMVSVMEELDRDGLRTSIVETAIRLAYDASGAVRSTEIVRATRDGKDIAEELRKDSEKGNRGSAGWDGMLFSDDARKRTRLLPGATWVVRNGRRTALVPFEMDAPGMGKMQGTAEIDAESGIPTIVRTSAGFLIVRDLTFSLEYTPLASGGFVLSRMEFAGTVARLFKRTRFRGSVVLGEYAEEPVEGTR